MITIISASKSSDFKNQNITKLFTIPFFKDEREKILEILLNFSNDDLKQLMGISDSLAISNYEKLVELKYFPKRVKQKQAILAYSGDVYKCLNPSDFITEDFEYAQKNLRILSALYGILRPLDLIGPYRLEMKIKIKSDGFESIYKFWTDKITEEINKDNKSGILINLSSEEYFKVINREKLNSKVIQPIFYDIIDGNRRIIPFHAKKSRGFMAREIIKNKLEDPEELKKLNINGFKYSEEDSNDEIYVYLRKQK